MRSTCRWVLSGLLAVEAVLLSACDALSSGGCPPVGYREGLHLEFHRPAWEPAAYRIQGSTDDGAFSCTISETHERACEPEWVTFEAYGHETLIFWNAPRTVSASLYRNEELLGSGTFEPRYHREEEIDGCGRPPLFAAETLELPGPPSCGIDPSCRCVYDDGCGCETDDVRSWPWSVCHGGTIPASSCSPGCACDGNPPGCVPSCEQSFDKRRPLCVAGTWSCADPAFPVPEHDCPSP